MNVINVQSWINSVQRETPKAPIVRDFIEPNQSVKPTVPRIHGLIIGIDKYKQSRVHPDLLGCVSDAQSMLEYFTNIGVPEDRLLCLYNEHATRDAIINAFMTYLINNPDIKPLDPIVIYFAGYGDRMPAPPGWQIASGKVEMILPHDVGTYNKHGHYNYGIPDLTLAFLLYKLSQEKGRNITVIMDSCQSGRSTHGRGVVRSRTSHDPESPPIPETLDAQLRKSLLVDYPTEVEHSLTSERPSGSLMAPSLDTHILLAACQRKEKAQEITNIDPNSGNMRVPEACGVFTTALLQELRSCDLTNTTYTTLIHSLLAAQVEISQIERQTFQCEGRGQDCLLFNIQTSSKGRIGLIQTLENAMYRIRVGGAQGVGPGTEFAVFSPTDLPTNGCIYPTPPPLATLVATDVGPTMSYLQNLAPNNTQDIPADAYATMIKHNNHPDGVRVWVDEATKQDEFWESVLSSLDARSIPIFWATSCEDHDIELVFSNGDAEIRGAHFIPGQFGTPHVLNHELKAQQLVKMLTAIIHFYCYLKHKNKHAPICEKLSMALWELKEKDSSWGSPYEVNGEDLFGESVPTGKITTIHPDPDKVYGLELVNNSQYNLFPYVLYFDFEDYSVGCLYEPPSRSGKAPLQAGKSMTIGYGSSGSQGFQVDFTNPKSDKEWGAFVLLVFSEWVDSRRLQQKSPFAADFHDPCRGERCDHSMTWPSIWDKLFWDSLIVQLEMVKGDKFIA